MLAAIAVVTLAVIGSVYVNMQPLLSRVDETIAVGAGGRPRIWKETLVVVRDFWPAGTGLGTYQDAMLVYQDRQARRLLQSGAQPVSAPALGRRSLAHRAGAVRRGRVHRAAARSPGGRHVADAMAANRRRDRDTCGGGSGHLGNRLAHAGQRRAVCHRRGRGSPSKQGRWLKFIQHSAFEIQNFFPFSHVPRAEIQNDRATSRRSSQKDWRRT